MVTCRVLFGLAIGLLVIKIKPGAGVFRTLLYPPYLAPPVAATLAFVFLLNPGTGPVNTILGSVGPSRSPGGSVIQVSGVVEAGAHRCWRCGASAT